MVAWPAVVKYLGDDELTFVDSPEQLDERPELQGGQFHPGDVLIDSAGQVYRPQRRLSRTEVSEEPLERLTLDAVLALVRRHAASGGACCVSKISAPSVAEAIALIKCLESPG